MTANDANPRRWWVPNPHHRGDRHTPEGGWQWKQPPLKDTRVPDISSLPLTARHPQLESPLPRTLGRGAAFVAVVLAVGLMHDLKPLVVALLLGLNATFIGRLLSDTIKRYRGRQAGAELPEPPAWQAAAFACGYLTLPLTWLLLRHDLPVWRDMLYVVALVMVVAVPALSAWYEYQLNGYSFWFWPLAVEAAFIVPFLAPADSIGQMVVIASFANIIPVVRLLWLDREDAKPYK
jgi:hypothetical protein